MYVVRYFNEDKMLQVIDDDSVPPEVYRFSALKEGKVYLILIYYQI